MNNESKIIIEPLGKNHERNSFSCGINSLDTYLKKQANQDIKRRVSRVFVAVSEDNRNQVVGYYTLSTLSIELTGLPDSLTRKLPKHPVPAALLGRLAVNVSSKGFGLGKMLLIDAIKRTVTVSNEIAIYAMVVDTINKDAQHFYEKYGFSLLSSSSKRLFLPLKAFKTC